MTDDDRDLAERTLGYRFRDPGLLERALRHASVAVARQESNERMEFLGDSVLGMIVAQRVYELYPDADEGEMTKIRSATVSRQSCAQVALELGVPAMLALGKGMQSCERLPHSLAGSALEAIIAAIYLDGGLDAARAFVVPRFDPLIDRAEAGGHQENFKSVLQQHAQQMELGAPSYRVLDEKGPDHARAFKVGVELGGESYPAKWGSSKKQAEQLAALAALQALGVIEETRDGMLKLVPADEEE